MEGFRRPIWAGVGALGLIGVIVWAVAWSGSPPRMYSVTGTVMIDGKASEKVTVYFWPANMDKRNFMHSHATGITDAQGRFSLRSGSGAEGIAAGEYRVTFSRLVVRGRAVGGVNRKFDQQGAVESIPARYREIDETQIVAHVSASQQDFPFDIASK